MLNINDWLYINTSDNMARFALGINGNNPLICFGINPSIATPDKSDPTINRVREFAKSNGFDGYIMLNVYPQRATDPNEIDLQRDSDLHEENIRQIIKIVERGSQTILAGWGNSIIERPFFMDTLCEIVNRISDRHYWVCLGLSKEGHPRHPLYIDGKEKFCEFEIKPYIKKFTK